MNVRLPSLPLLIAAGVLPLLTCVAPRGIPEPPADPDPSLATEPRHLADLQDAVGDPTPDRQGIERATTADGSAWSFRLGVGDGVFLTTREAVRFRLAADDSARYALAFFDPDRVRRAAVGPEGPPPETKSYWVRLRDRGGSDRGRTGTAMSFIQSDFPDPQVAAGSAREDHANAPEGRRRAAAEARDAARGREGCDDETFVSCDLRHRSRPWRAGDRFRMSRRPGEPPVSVRTVKTYGDHFVLAVTEDDSERLRPELQRRIDRAFEVILEEGLNVLTGTFSRTPPVTSTDADQYLVILGALESNGLTSSRLSPRGAYSWSHLKVDHEGEIPSFAAILDDLTHELTHAWGARYLFESRPDPSRAPGWSAYWAREGVAELIAQEISRRHFGIGRFSNWDWRDEASSGGGFLAKEVRRNEGTLTSGYHHAASFLRTLALELERDAGLSRQRALRAVSRGALEGWYGIDEYESRRTGLTRRMRRHLGPDWHPERAVLRWTVTEAVDDRTPLEDYQDPSYLRTGSRPFGGAGWQAAMEFEGGRGDEATAYDQFGSSGYFLIHDPVGSLYELSHGGAAEEVRWYLLRYR